VLAAIRQKGGRMQEKMDELTNRKWAPVPARISPKGFTSAFQPLDLITGSKATLDFARFLNGEERAS